MAAAAYRSAQRGRRAVRSSARGTSVQLIAPIASRSAVPGHRSPRPVLRVARRHGEPEQPVAELRGVHAQRAAGVGPGQPPARGDEVRAVPQLEAPAPERQPARGELVQRVGELEAFDRRHGRHAIHPPPRPCRRAAPGPRRPRTVRAHALRARRPRRRDVRRQPRHRTRHRRGARARRRAHRADGQDGPAAPEAARARSTPPPRRSRRRAARRWPIVGDVRDDAQVEAFVAAAAERWGRIDVVVNNASAINLAPLADLPPKRYDLMLDINVRGTYLLTRAALPHLRASDHAHVLTLSPPLSTDPRWLRGHAAYTVSKMGDDDAHARRRRGRARARRRRQRALAAHADRHRGRAEPARRRQGDGDEPDARDRRRRRARDPRARPARRRRATRTSTTRCSPRRASPTSSATAPRRASWRSTCSSTAGRRAEPASADLERAQPGGDEPLLTQHDAPVDRPRHAGLGRLDGRDRDSRRRTNGLLGLLHRCSPCEGTGPPPGPACAKPTNRAAASPRFRGGRHWSVAGDESRRSRCQLPDMGVGQVVPMTQTTELPTLRAQPSRATRTRA